MADDRDVADDVGDRRRVDDHRRDAAVVEDGIGRLGDRPGRRAPCRCVGRPVRAASYGDREAAASAVAPGLLESACGDSCGPGHVRARPTAASPGRPSAAPRAVGPTAHGRCGLGADPRWRDRGRVRCARLRPAPGSFSLISRVCRPGATYRYSTPIATSVIAKNTSASRLRSEIRGRLRPAVALEARCRGTGSRRRAP